MSGEVALWAARQDISNHAAKMVLIALGDAFDDRTGRCFPSKEAIGDFVRRGPTQIKAALRWLEDNGWLKREARFDDKTKRQTSNSYEIIFERGETFLAMVARRRKIRGERGSGEGGEAAGRAEAENRPGPGRDSGHLSQTEARPPLTESLVNNSAQARDDENDDVVEGVDWRNRLVQYRKRAIWPPKWGPAMDMPGCRVPPHLVSEWKNTKGEAFRDEKQARKPQAEPKSWTKAIRGSKSKADGRNLPGTSHD